VLDLPSLAAHEARQVVIFTGDVLTTTAALLTSALSFVAALAWNTFMQAWLPTVNLPNLHNTVVKQLVYALAVTLIAVLSVALISRIRKRIRGRNLFTP
jgi:MFS superfamily sulfate permease-like transporter